MTALVHQVAVNGPATHVVIIGVGRYPHLEDGDPTKKLADTQGLGQLSSPPVSAHAFAQWVIASFNDPGRPLSSVRLLISEKPAKKFVHPTTKKSLKVERATIDNIDKAIGDWYGEGNANPENLLLFYFCGHGLDTALLTEDFGAKAHNPLDGAIDFERFHAGMRTCAAKYQCFFVDACRSKADLLAYGDGVAGRPLVLPSALARPKQQPIFYATLTGADAHGEENEVSFFTRALLEALDGAGSERTGGQWLVSTIGLQKAIWTNMNRRKVEQLPPANHLTNFFVHRLPGVPNVPVYVSCDPDAALGEVTLVCSAKGGFKEQKKPPLPRPWPLVLPAGNYLFEAIVPNGAGFQAAEIEEYVQPPEVSIPIKVTA